MFIFLALVIVAVFSYMFYSRHRDRGTIALHRHPYDLRRKRNEPTEITTTADILGIVSDSRTRVIIIKEKTPESIEG